MQQLDLLWNYQRVDLQLDQVDHEIKQTPVRKRMVQVRNFFINAQNGLKKLEAEADGYAGKIQKVQGELKALSARLAQAQREFDELGEEVAMDQVESARKQASVLNNQLTQKERELSAVIREMEEMEKRYRTLRAGMVQAKKEFDSLKVEYDALLKQYEPRVNEIKTRRTQAEEGIDAALLEKYRKIKGSRPNPMATVEHDQCMGCNMSLPSATMTLLKDGARIVECENCGRILYLKSE
ncbi:MAG: zinc ribbon domain-containing protein [Christensenellales bacterium]|jgi:predicted  nucleic acid-binding Zn-ribbon protein